MLRTLALYPLPAVLIASGWGRLDDRGDDALMVGLLLLAVLPALVRPWWGRVVAALGVTLLAVDAIYGLAPGRGYAQLWSRFRDGALGFYDVKLPFPAADEPLLHDVTLLAIFGFALAFGIALAARRPVAASGVLLLGAVWPAAIVPANDLARGAVLLATVLALLAFGGRRPTRAIEAAAVAAILLVAVGVAASTSSAVAKPQFLAWESWDFYDRPDDPVGVGFVWNATYRGFEWPEKETPVLKVTGPQRNVYWRATTLDTFRRDHWVEDVPIVAFVEDEFAVTEFVDAQVPTRGYDSSRWLRAEVKVEALRDTHLVGPSMPVAYDADGTFRLGAGGVATADEPLKQGSEYTVWAYAPQPRPQQLARARGFDVQEFGRFLEIAPEVSVPRFGAPNRDATVRERLERANLGEYEALFERARAVVGSPTNQYAAVVGLEAWFQSEGGFTYDEQPPPAGALPPLVAFVEDQRGYCQHYAGAMALMLRYLGIPARVAVGFTSGAYDEPSRTWTVTDHDAHAWVEVWFQGWGWIPFDPTPGRGQFSGPYSFAGINFDAAGVGGVLDQSGFGGTDSETAQRIRGLSERKAGEQLTSGGGAGGVGVVVRERGASLLKLLLIVAAAAAVGIQLTKRVVRGRRYLTGGDARRFAAASRQELMDFLVDQGIELPKSATPLELARELQRELDVDAKEFVRALSAARYAPERDSRAAGRRLRRELRSLRREIRLRLGVPRRVRGAVSLRSLAA